MKNIYKMIFKGWVCAAIVLLFFISKANAQIVGSTRVLTGRNYTYTYTSTQGVISNPVWDVIGGTVVSSSSNGNTCSAIVIFLTGTRGTLTLFGGDGGILGQLPLIINVGSPIGFDGFTCGVGSVTLRATPAPDGVDINWYSGNEGSSILLFKGATFVTPVLSATTSYYAASVRASGGDTPTSERTRVTASVYPVVGAPNISPVSRCGPGIVTFSAVPGSNASGVKWYTTASGGTPLSDSNTYSVALSSTTTYYVSSYSISCESERVPVTAMVLPLPIEPAQQAVSKVCVGDLVELSGTPGDGGNTLVWYTSSSSTTALATGLNYSPGISETTSYYIASKQTATGCESATRSVVTVMVNPKPAVPIAGVAPARFGIGNLTLQASGAGKYQWYDPDQNVLTGETSATLTRPFTGIASYAVRAVNGNCQSDLLTITGNVFPYPKISANGSTVVQPSQNFPQLSIATPVYTTYQWRKDGVAVGMSQSTYQPTAAGLYTVEVSLANGLKAISESLRITLLNNTPQNNAPIVSDMPPLTGPAASRKNYTRVYTPREEVTATTDVTFSTINPDKVTVEIVYLDGLGLDVQHVSHQSSATNADIVLHQEYDQFIRQPKEYLPYATNSATDADGYRYNARAEQYQYYRNGTANIPVTGIPYTEKQFEASPESRVLKQAAPGEAWRMGSGHEVKTDTWSYYPDIDGNIIIWTVNDNDQLVQSANYAVMDLTVTAIRNEDDGEAREYKDNEGRVVLKRVKDDGNQWLSTYYVYDQFNNLRFVLPPEFVNNIPGTFDWATHTTSLLNPLAFQYRYDARQRATEKKVPGAGWIYTIYDKLDRPVLTQDARQRLYGMWTFIKYDILGRPVITGLYKARAGETYATLQAAISTQTSYESRTGTTDYTLTAALPQVNESLGDTLLTKTYYDNYALPAAFDTWSAFVSENAIPAKSDRVMTLTVASQVRNLSDLAWLGTVNYYDNRNRVIQTTQQNHLGGKDRVSLRYVGITTSVANTMSTHEKGAQSTKIQRAYTYDRAMRMKTVTHRIGTGPEVILSSNDYNENGQLVTKRLHGPSTWKQTVNYAYNIRGFLTNINDAALTDPTDYFGMELYYDNGFTQGYNNGNISGAIWSRAYEDKKQAYGYIYDNVSRLRLGDYRQANASGTGNVAEGNFNEYIKAYDANGNIKGLTRNGLNTDTKAYGLMDDLFYTYTGNQLLKVSDASLATIGFKDGTNTGNDYAYDVNGSMITDANKNIASGGIAYNHLNLVKRVAKNTDEYLTYAYDATGRKLRQSVYDASDVLKKQSDYVGEYFYENDTLKFINHEEGRVVMTGSTPEYQYFLKDHLGNVRVTFTTKEETETATATLENTNAVDEQNQFLNYDEAVRVNFDMFDHTQNGKTPTSGMTYYATRLSGAAGGRQEKYGLAKSLSVMPGDKVNVEVFAKYLDPNTANWNAALTTFMTMVATGQAPSGTVIDGGGIGSSVVSQLPFPNLPARNDNGGSGPKAYLNWIIFDRNYNYLDGGFRRVSEAARETGSNGAHETLNAEITIKSAGYVYIYLSNENETSVDVFFDDFKVERIKSEIVQQSDYYPFGLIFNEYQRESSIPNPYFFNGKEKQNELDLEWLDYGARMYMADIGRWGVIDRSTEKFYEWTPYNFSFCNPIRFLDPDGNEPGDVIITRMRRFNGKDERGNYNVQRIGDLGLTGVMGFQKDAKGRTQVIIEITYNFKFVDGPYKSNNPNSQLNLDNPGLFEEVQAHEESHADQFEDILKTAKDFSYGKHTGNIVDVFDAAYSDIALKFTDLVKGAATEKQANTLINQFKGTVSALVGSLSQQAADKVDTKYGGRQNVENDANRRATNRLKSQGKNINYINYRRRAVYEGELLGN